jgi:hypothetical protein
MEGVGANDDFFRFAFVLFEFVGVENHVDEDGMCFVEIDDFKHIFGEGDGSIGENIFDGGYHIPYGLDLNSFYGQYIRFFVHLNAI